MNLASAKSTDKATKVGGRISGMAASQAEERVLAAKDERPKLSLGHGKSVEGRSAAKTSRAANVSGSIRVDGVKNAVKPVSNAIRILKLLGETSAPTRATKIAQALSINASTCFNILKTLVAEGVVAFDPVGKTYTIGVGMFNLVDNTLSEGQRIAAARPILFDLASRFEVTTTLWRPIGQQRILLVSAEYTPGEMRVHLSAGLQLPLLMGATGRLFAHYSGMSRAELRTAFKELRWKQPLSFAGYLEQVEAAMDRGWSMDDGYFTQGVTSVAVPILDSSNKMIYSMSAVMFRHAYDQAAIEKIGREMLRLVPSLRKILGS